MLFIWPISDFIGWVLIYDEENIPETIKIDGLEDINENLDDDMINKQGINFNYFFNNLT